MSIFVSLLSGCSNAVNQSGSVVENADEKINLTEATVDEQVAAFKNILAADDSNEIIEEYKYAYLEDNGNIEIDGVFCGYDGLYKVLCWESHPYQIEFIYDTSKMIDSEAVSEKLSNVIGDNVYGYEDFTYIDDVRTEYKVCTWHSDDTEIYVNPKYGTRIGKLYNIEKDEIVLDPAIIAETDYMSLSQEKIDYDIGLVETLMSYKEKPKLAVYQDYPDMVDVSVSYDVEIPGRLFGVDGKYSIPFDKYTGLATGEILFSWTPNDIESHQNHFKYCLDTQFGEDKEFDKQYYDSQMYYKTLWNDNSENPWYVSLKLSQNSGTLYMTKLVKIIEEPELPEERPEADDYDEFKNVINDCFAYIPDCDLSFGSEDTGSSNSYAIKSNGQLIGILGINLDDYDVVSLIDPDKENADLHHEQMAVAMIMSVDSKISYEDAKNIFEASIGDSESISTGIYCFEGIVEDMKAFGIDITWLS